MVGVRCKVTCKVLRSGLGKLEITVRLPRRRERMKRRQNRLKG